MLVYTLIILTKYVDRFEFCFLTFSRYVCFFIFDSFRSSRQFTYADRNKPSSAIQNRRR